MDEQTKAQRAAKREKDQAYVNQLAAWLSNIGVQPPVSIHGKLDAILEMLVEAGVVTEDQIAAMEEKYADSVINALEETTKHVRTEAMKQGIPLPPLPASRSGLITL